MVTIKKDFKINFNQKTVMKLIECSEKSPIYDQMLEEFSDLSKEYISKIKPIVLMEFGEIPKEISSEKIKEGSKALFCIASVGNELSNASTQEFTDGDYVAGLLLDAMSDDVLFQLEGLIKQDIIQMCKARKLGVRRRLESPNDIPMESQKLVWKMTDAYNIAGIKINESFMLDPVKSLCVIYLLDEACTDFNVNHVCSNCTSYDCPLRNVPPKKVTVLLDDSSKEIWVKEKQSLLDAMVANGIYVPAICGGRGSCGKCGITLIKGTIPISKEDKKFFSEAQLKSGKRLSCKAYPKSNCIVSLKEEEESFEVLTNLNTNQVKLDVHARSESLTDAIVVDIGTTTIAMQRINSVTGEVFDTVTAINKQRAYGADVITRIQASNDGHLENLKNSIRSQLSLGLQKLITKDTNKVSQMVIAANTTMVHLLMGYPCDTLGVTPYKAYNLNTIDTLFENIPLTILPGISTFVGADITSGILVCNMDIDNKISLLIDLGTNGEMALGNKDKLLVTSAAAGPALEGGNISSGIGSINGAICNVKIKDKKNSSINTIGNKAPIGICGTGVVETVSELLSEDLIDETGLLVDEYFENGYKIATSESGNPIYFTQKDVREVQLAKSAMRACIETLLIRYGISYENVANVYLAGGFGYKMDIDKAINIGMLPKEFRDKISTVGNSSLNGCIKYATDKTQRLRADNICKYAKEISLATDKKFNEFYSTYMMFDDEEI